MSELLIEVEGAWWSVDLQNTEESPITTTHRKEDTKDLGDPRSSFANNVVIVGSPKTLRALRYGHRFDQIKGSGLIGKKYNALYLEDGVDVLGGPAVLEIGSITTSNEVVLFECYLTGGRYRWLQDIQNINLRDCDLGIHTFSYQNVIDSMDWATNGRFIHGVYLPIDYGTWIQPPFTVQLLEMEFSPYVKSVIEAAHEAIGWTVEGGAWWNDEAEHLIMPHVGKLVKGNTADKQGVRAFTVNLKKEFQREFGEGPPTCLDGGTLNPNRLRTFVIVPGSQINCSTTMLSDTRGLVRCAPPDKEFTGDASFQYQIYCDPDGTGGGASASLLGVYTCNLSFEDPYKSTDYKQVKDAEISVPFIGEQLYNDQDYLRMPVDFYEAVAVQRGTVAFIDDNTPEKPPFQMSEQYGLDMDGAYTIPFDGMYSVWFNMLVTRSDPSSVWHLQIISDQRGVLAWATLNATTYDNIVLQEEFLNWGELLTFKLVLVSGTGTVSLKSREIDTSGSVPVVLPSFRLEVMPKISITPREDGNFYDAFPQDFQVVASHAHKDFNVLEMMAGLQHARNLKFIPDNSQKVLYIYRDVETFNVSLPPVDISSFVQEGAPILEQIPPNFENADDEGNICKNVVFRWKPDPADGFVEYYQKISGNDYLHGENVPKTAGVCAIEKENPFFSPTALKLAYMGSDPDLWAELKVPEYLSWFLCMQPDEEEIDFSQIKLEIIEDPTSFSWDQIEDDQLWEGRVTHDYNFRIAYYHGIVNPETDNDYFDDWFLLGTFAKVGFNLRYWDGSTYVERNIIENAIPYAYMIDMWGQNPLSPALTFRREKFTHPAYFSSNYVEANPDLFQTMSRTVVRTLKSEDWMHVVRRYQSGRYFEVPVTLSVQDLQGLLTLDRRKYYDHPELGRGVFHMDAVRDFNHSNGTAMLELWEEEPTCEAGTCLPGLDSLDVAISATKVLGDSSVVFELTFDNTLDEIVTMVDTSYTIYNGFDNSELFTAPIYGAILLSTGAYNLSEVTLGDAGFETTAYGEINYKLVIQGSLQYYNQEGELCGYSFCYEIGAVVEEDSYQEIYASLNSACRFPPFMYSNFQCFETVSGLGSFPDYAKSDLPASDLEAIFDTSRKWRLDEMYHNGSPINTKFWGSESTWWSNTNANVGYIQAVNDGTYASAPTSSANNTENFFKWFNSHFAYGALDYQGFPTTFESPIYFRPSGDRVLMRVSNQYPGNVVLKLSKFSNDVDTNPEYQYEIQVITTGTSGVMLIKNGVTGVTQMAYTIRACTSLPEPELSNQYCTSYGLGLLGGIGAAKFSDLTPITGFFSGRIKYIVEHFEVDLGGNEAAGENFDMIIPTDTVLAPGTYQGVALPDNVCDFFNALPYVHPTAFRFTDGGSYYEHNSARNYRISIREEVYENNLTTLSSTWRFIVDTEYGIIGGDSAFVTTALFGSGSIPAASCTDMDSLFNQVPVVTDVTISGTTQIGQSLSLTKTYSDIEGDLEDTTDPARVKWYEYPSEFDATNNTNATLVGTGTTLSLASGVSVGTYIRASYTPEALTGASPGVLVWSNILGPVYANTTLITYDTDDDPTHSVTIKLSFDSVVVVDWGDSSPLQTVNMVAGVQQTLLHNYSAGDHTVVMYGVPDFLTKFDVGANLSSVKGTLDISANPILVYLDVEDSIGLTDLTTGAGSQTWVALNLNGTGLTGVLDWGSDYDFVPQSIDLSDVAITSFGIYSHVQNIERFVSAPSSLAALNLSGVSTMSGIVEIDDATYTTLQWPSASSGPFDAIFLGNLSGISGLSGTQSFEWITHDVDEFVFKNIPGVTLLEGPSSDMPTTTHVEGCAALATIDFSAAASIGSDTTIHDVLSLTTLILPGVSQTLDTLRVSSTLLDTLDLSDYTVNGHLNISDNASLATFSPPAGGALAGLQAWGNDSLALPDFTACTLLGTADVDFSDCDYTTEEVNQLLVDLVTMSAAVGSGTATGTITITGINEGPDTFTGGLNGIAAKVTLEDRGFTVLINPPSTFTLTYETNQSGSHDPYIRYWVVDYAYYDWGDGTAGWETAIGGDNYLSHTYADGTTKTVKVCVDPAAFQRIYLDGCDINGSVVLDSGVTAIQELLVQEPGLNSITLPPSEAWTKVWLNGSAITDAVFPVGTAFANVSLQLANCTNLTTLDFLGYDGTVLFFSCDNSGLTDVDLTMLTFNNATVSANYPDCTSLDISTSGGTISRVIMNLSSISGSFVIGPELSGTLVIRLHNLAGITNISWTPSVSSPPNVTELRVQFTAISTLSFAGINIANAVLIAASNTNITDVDFGTGNSGPLRSLTLTGNSLSGWLDFGGYTIGANCGIYVNNIGWSAAIVNEALHHMDPVGSGDRLLAPTATTGIIRIDGNSPPDGTSGGYDGSTAADNIVLAGYVLYVDS